MIVNEERLSNLKKTSLEKEVKEIAKKPSPGKIVVGYQAAWPWQKAYFSSRLPERG